MAQKQTVKSKSPIRMRVNKYVGLYLSIILFVIAFGLGMVSGRIFYVHNKITGESGEVELSRVLELNRDLNKSESLKFDQFWSVWDNVRTKYVKGDVSEEDLFYGAIQGMVASLGDPYSIYLPPQQAGEFTKDLSGELEGIGAEIGIKNNELTVVSPLPESPAEKAGLKPGDKILAIDGESSYGMDVGTAVGKIRGEAGTEVVLTVKRDKDGSLDIKITRAKINVPAVMYSMKGDIAYLRILQFNENTMNDFNKATKYLLKNNAKGIVLDLRGNPGGFLTASVDMADQWLADKLVVSEKGRDGLDEEIWSRVESPLLGIKTVVLIDRGSASASEIVAGALRDNGAAVLMGEKSFGKGSVQDFETFNDGSALKLTVAEWFTPGGKNINEEGIDPDIKVESDWSQEAVGEDKVLDEALGLFSSSTFRW